MRTITRRTPTPAERQKLHQQLALSMQSTLRFPEWAAIFLCDAANLWTKIASEDAPDTPIEEMVPDLMRLAWSYAILAERMGLDTDTIGRTTP